MPLEYEMPHGDWGNDAADWRGTDAEYRAKIDEATREAEQSQQQAKGSAIPSRAALIPTPAEISAASLSPRCIVENMLYADVAQIAAPGGTGKTTIMLHEAACMALGWPVWGCKTLSSGWSLIVTAEDQRPQLLARLREITAAMNLTDKQRQQVYASVIVWDVTGSGLKLIELMDGNMVIGSLVDKIIETHKADPPISITFDPLISFGASEQAVNDNEQALVTAARRIVKGLDCAVRLIHHTGKANARNGTLDQYSGRGGSALADGSRMTTILQPWQADSEQGKRPPSACKPDSGSSITILSRAKLSYAPPNLPLIWIKRSGFAFESFTELQQTAEQISSGQADQLERFLISQYQAGRFWTKRELERCRDHSLTRREAESAITELRVSGRVVDGRLPSDQRQGGRQSYLHPTNCPKPDETLGAVPEN